MAAAFCEHDSDFPVPRVPVWTEGPDYFLIEPIDDVIFVLKKLSWQYLHVFSHFFTAYLISGCPTLILIALILLQLTDFLYDFKCRVPRWIAATSSVVRKLERKKSSNGVTSNGRSEQSEPSILLTDGPLHTNTNSDDWALAALTIRLCIFIIYFFACCLLAVLTYVL